MALQDNVLLYKTNRNKQNRRPAASKEVKHYVSVLSVIWELRVS